MTPAHPLAGPAPWQKRALLLGFGLVALFYLGTAWLPLEDLVGLCLADDAFYYQTIARNLARGAGPSFDGQIPTNGFHPLLMGLLWLAWKGVSDPTSLVPLRISLTVLALASLGTGVLLYRLVAPRLGARAAVVAAALWLLDPHVWVITMHGLEAPLAVLLLSWTVVLALRAPDPHDRTRSIVALGAWLGLACLARTDAVIPAVLLLAGRLWREGRALGWPAAVRRASLRSVAAVAVVTPWLLWNLVTFGRISQDSARALSFTRHSLWASSHGPADLPRKLLRNLTETFGLLLDYTGLGARWVPLLWLLAGWIALWAGRWIVRRRAPAAAPAPDVSTAALPVAFFWQAPLLTLAFYALVFWFHQRWYYLAPLAWLAVLGSWSFARLEAALAKPLARTALFAGTLLALAGLQGATARSLLRNRIYPWQETYLALARRMPLGVVGPMRLGSFNSGIYGFFAPPVVNLDGVVNGQAFEALRARRLLGYLRDDLRLTHVLDHVSTVRAYIRLAEPDYASALRPVTLFAAPGGGGPIMLFEIQRPHK